MDRFNKVCEVVVGNDNPITRKNHFLHMHPAHPVGAIHESPYATLLSFT
jgi:hypothetical protein